MLASNRTRTVVGGCAVEAGWVDGMKDACLSSVQTNYINNIQWSFEEPRTSFPFAATTVQILAVDFHA